MRAAGELYYWLALQLFTGLMGTESNKCLLTCFKGARQYEWNRCKTIWISAVFLFGRAID